MLSEHLIGLNLPIELQKIERSGELTKAMQWIDANASETLAVEKERLHRLKLEYNLTADEMLAKIHLSLPDATMGDLERWTKLNHIMTESIDGYLRYFKREPSNLWRRSEEARERKNALTPKSPTLVADPASISKKALLDNVLETLDGTTMPMHYKVHHKITILPNKVPKGEIISCWVPLPQEYRQQTGPQDLQSTPTALRAVPAGENMRTLYMEQPSLGAEPTEFNVTYKYSISSFYVPNLDATKVAIDPSDPIVKKHLGSQPPHIMVNDEVSALAKEIVGTEQLPLKQAELIWCWMQDHIKYESEMNYTVLPSCIGKIMATHSGDCGIQAIMFISLCRSLGIPARWQSGWVTHPRNWNMHDWAEIYMPPYGWLPVDPSVGYINSTDRAVKHFLFTGIDAYRMIANLECAVPFTPAERFLRSDPVDNQTGEVQWRGGNLYFQDWSYDVTVAFAPEDSAQK